MLPVRIMGTGWALPEHRVTNEDLAQRLEIPARWIERVTGIRERRYITHETQIGQGAKAAQMALHNAGLGVEDLDAIVCAQTAPQQAIPCSAAFLQRALGASEGKTACFDINATCLSFAFALYNVAHLVAADAYRTVLICTSEYGSRSLNPKERESAVLFGDAAAAVVLTRDGSSTGTGSVLWHALFETYHSGAELTELRGGGTMYHPNDPETTPETNMFHMRGPAILKMGTALIGPFLDRFFAALPSTWTRTNINAVIPHQASRHAIEQLTRRVGFNPAQLILNIAERGNCIAASIPLAFAEAIDAGRIKRSDRVLLIGTGAGLTMGALAMTY